MSSNKISSVKNKIEKYRRTKTKAKVQRVHFKKRKKSPVIQVVHFLPFIPTGCSRAPLTIRTATTTQPEHSARLICPPPAERLGCQASVVSGQQGPAPWKTNKPATWPSPPALPGFGGTVMSATVTRVLKWYLKEQSFDLLWISF